MKKLFKEFTSNQLARLKKEYDPLKGKTLSTDQWKRMEAMLAKYPTPMLVKIAKADIPMLATAAKSELVIKRKTHKWSDFRQKMDMGESLQVMEEITEACWVGYKQVGMKDKGGRQVPNCVPDPDNKISKQKKEKVNEVDLSKSQIKKVEKQADDLPKNDFIKRYGKDGDSVRYATATNMVKKKLGIGEEVELEEGRMKELHTLIQQGKSAEEISKIMGLDVKTIKSLMPKEDVEEAFTKKDFKANERDNEHGENAKIVVGLFGTPQDVAVIDAINARHKKQRYISREDQKKRDAIVNKYYSKLKEQRAHTSPEVAAALRQYVAQRPLLWRGEVGKADKKDFEELMRLSLKDMKAFNKKFNSMDTDPRDGVRQALMKKGLQSHLTDETKQRGDQTMNESYKDKFNATMKKFGINSLDDLKSDEEKKKFFKAVDNAHDTKNEEVLDEKLSSQDLKDVKVNNYVTIKGRQYVIDKLLPNNKIKVSDKRGDFHTFNINDVDSVEDWKASNKITRSEDMQHGYDSQGKSLAPINAMKTGDDDLTPDALKLNAMVKDPHKSKGDNPKKDMNAMYMKSDVRADVKNGGGADMSKVNDKPKIQAALKKISASYESRKYHDTKPGSIQDAIMQMQMDEYRMITVEDKKLDDMIKTYLAKGGTITKLPPALQKGSKPSDMKKHKIGDKGVVKSMYKMKEVREFITTYNSHFLTNFKAEEFILKDRLEG